MCGIVGFNWDDPELLRRMTDVLVHRGPDAADSFAVPGKLSLGHRRLSIVDLHERSTQPLRYEHAGRAFVITFNGEIYNYQPLRSELQALGFAFHTTSDTEVILAAYAAWGDSCVTRFNGMWAFALFDEREQKLFLSRDRFGKKPLYYSCTGDGRFIFASEIKAVLQTDRVRRIADTERVSDLLIFGLVGHTERTFFRDVRQLPAGSNGVLELGSGRFRTRRYYTLPEGERKVATDELRSTLRDAVQRRLISDVPICLSLSGGIDSSSVASLISDVHDDRMVAFTTIANGPGDETVNVNKLLEMYRQYELVKVPLALDDFPELLSKMVYHMDEPFIYDSPFGRWCIAKAIHEHGFKVSVTGEGADELLGGYQIASPLFLLDLMRRKRFGRLAVELVHHLKQPDYREILARVASQFFESRRRRVLHYFLDNARSSGCRLTPTGTGAPLQEYDVTLKEKLHTQMGTFFLPYLLACNDKMYMAHSVEARAPFLDVEVAELFLQVATEDLVVHGYRKYPLREAMQGRVPDSVLFDRKKIGFASPMRAQFGTPQTKAWVRDLFREPCSDAFVEPGTFLRAYEEQSAGQHINDFFANVVTLELWMRTFDVTSE